MTFNEIDHPRTATGAPDAGQFAHKPAGSEAEHLLGHSDLGSRIARIVNDAGPQFVAADIAMADAHKAKARAVIDMTKKAVVASCHLATGVHWLLSEVNSGDSADVYVSCPHVGDRADIYTFESAHEVPRGAISDSGATTLEAQDAEHLLELEWVSRPYSGYAMTVDPHSEYADA